MGLRVTSESSFWRELEGPPVNRTGSFFSVQVCQMPEAQPARLPAGERDLETQPVPPQMGFHSLHVGVSTGPRTFPTWLPLRSQWDLCLFSNFSGVI